jgi:hypothetical protein
MSSTSQNNIEDFLCRKLKPFIRLFKEKRAEQSDDYLPNINGAKYQSIQQMVNITANKFGMFNHDIKPDSVVVPNKDTIKVRKLMKSANGNTKVKEIIAL